jgi:hypothetical protein
MALKLTPTDDLELFRGGAISGVSQVLGPKNGAASRMGGAKRYLFRDAMGVASLYPSHNISFFQKIA